MGPDTAIALGESFCQFGVQKPHLKIFNDYLIPGIGFNL